MRSISNFFVPRQESSSHCLAYLSSFVSLHLDLTEKEQSVAVYTFS